MFGWLSALFVNAPLLLGMTAAAIPFVLHLIYRRRAPRIPFSTLRFIRASAERTSRRRKIQEWLLLLLRAGALFLLALALAGPILRSAGAGGGRDTAVALVVDNSYSMDAEFEGRSRYGRASEYALETLRGLGEGGEAALISAWPSGGAHGEEILTTDRNRLAGELAVSEVSIVQGDLAAAITRAEKILSSAPTDQREIYIFTDLQRATWRPVPPREDASGPPVIVVDCSPGDQPNVAVTNLDVIATRAAVGVPLHVRAKVRNMGGPAAEVAVSFYVDREKREERTVWVETDATAEVSFSHSFASAGAHAGWVDIAVGDALARDNRRYFCIDVPERIRVAVVREKAGTLPLLDEAFFLIPALNPLAASGKGTSTIEPVPMLRENLAGADLGSFSAVFLLNIPELSVGEMTLLADYAKGGGGVVIFPGDEVNGAAWNSASDTVLLSDKGLLPARLGALLGQESGGDQVTLTEVDREHPVFAAFSRMPAAFFNRVRVTNYFDLQVEHGSRARVVAQLSNGKPFLVEKEIGMGRVLLFCTAATAEWSNLPTRTIFLPLLHRITHYLARSGESATIFTAGGVVQFPSDAGGAPQVDVIAPGGAVSRAHVEEGGVVATFKDTARAGIYRWKEAASGTRQGAFVVNVDTTESDLAALTREEAAEKMLGGRSTHFARDAKDARAIAMRMRRGLSLSGPMLFVVIALVIAECFFANRAPSAASGTSAEGRKIPGRTLMQTTMS